MNALHPAGQRRRECCARSARRFRTGSAARASSGSRARGRAVDRLRRGAPAVDVRFEGHDVPDRRACRTRPDASRWPRGSSAALERSVGGEDTKCLHSRHFRPFGRASAGDHANVGSRRRVQRPEAGTRPSPKRRAGRDHRGRFPAGGQTGLSGGGTMAAGNRRLRVGRPAASGTDGVCAP